MESSSIRGKSNCTVMLTRHRVCCFATTVDGYRVEDDGAVGGCGGGEDDGAHGPNPPVMPSFTVWGYGAGNVIHDSEKPKVDMTPVCATPPNVSLRSNH